MRTTPTPRRLLRVLTVTGLAATLTVGLTPAAHADPTPATPAVATSDDRPAFATSDQRGSALPGINALLRTTTLCPVNRVVLGGGARVIGAGSANFQTVLQENAPGSLGGQSLWLAALSNNGAVSRTVRVNAVCAASLAGYQIATSTHTVPGLGGFVRSTAICPQGRVVLGGGAQVVGAGSGNFQTIIRETGPGTVGGQSAWLAAVTNNGSVSRSVRIYAICASAPSGYQINTTDHTISGFGGFVRSSTLCSTGRVVLGGGAHVIGAGSGNFGTVVRETGPGTVSGQPSWLGAVSNFGLVTRTVRISAICATAPAGYSVQFTDHTVLP